MKIMHMVAFLLLVIGGLNWLLVGVMGYDISMYFGGQTSMIAKVIYILVGLSAIFELITHKSACKTCTTEMPM